MKKIRNYTRLATIIVFCSIFASCEKPHVHSWKTEETKLATCTEKGEITRTCQECGFVEKETTPAKGHGKKVEEETVKATCTTEGEIKITCFDCGKELEEPRIIPALGHDVKNYKEDIIKKANCTENGSKNLICPRCNTVCIEKEKIPALGHDWGTASVVDKATCTEEGKAVRVCKRCSQENYGVIPKIPHNYTISDGLEKYPSCTEKGLERLKCNMCKTASTNKEVSSLGHSFTVPGDILREAKAFEEGLREYKCIRCEEKKSRAISPLHVHYNASTIPSPWDDTNSFKNNVASTCKTPGKVYAYCSCYIDENGNFHTRDEVETLPSTWKRYMITDTNGEPIIKTVSLNTDNHEGPFDYIDKEERGYFTSGVSIKRCLGCNTSIGVTENTGEPHSPEGKWTINYTFDLDDEETGETITTTLLADIEAYSNGISVFSYMGSQGPKGGPYILSEEVENYISYSSPISNLVRSVDGRWISEWETIYNKDNPGSQKSFVFCKGTYISLIVSGDSYSKKTIDFAMPDNTTLTVKRKDNPTAQGILGIQSNGLSTASSFSKDQNGISVVKIPEGQEVILIWYNLTETPIPSSLISWSVNGVRQSSGDKLTLSKIDSATLVECTANGNKYSVKLAPTS